MYPEESKNSLVSIPFEWMNEQMNETKPHNLFMSQSPELQKWNAGTL